MGAELLRHESQDLGLPVVATAGGGGEHGIHQNHADPDRHGYPKVQRR